MNRMVSAFSGTGLMARVLRSASWLIIGYGGSQALRLAANLVLTRILFPEAFGLMALVSVVTVGLNLFSDVGLGPSIAQNKRGDDPDFLDTAWTIQVMRGVLLFGLAWAVAGPVATFYGEPELKQYLPIAAVALLVSGVNPTRIETAHRHLLVGRLTLLDLASQVIGIGFMVWFATATGSVLSLVFGGVVQAVAKLLLTHYCLPGPRNQFRWEKAAAYEIAHFGKWIFLSTGLAFLISQGDRAILGRFLTLEVLGLYNIGFFLGSFPSMLGHAVTQKIMIPIYRDRPAHEDQASRRKQRLLRAAMTCGIVGLLLVMAAVGPWLIDVLYDDRYHLSGPIVTLIACALVPQAIIMTYDSAALAAGDSRSFFLLSLVKATSQTLCIILGVQSFGLIGAMAGLGLSMIFTYPALVWLSVKHRVWDPIHDMMAAVISSATVSLLLWYHWEQISALSQM
ncbi:oligosaccharide flippase family protein [Tropicibacter sp. Alg240-R139]|uniref:oligosaccharide flippase family protein n=1 Tax=Tropicibacter sp. Alg240-R139 TaxID=2305991 RepID=UPI0013E0B113|nr:oligosaccharide flippase family protein [Tropicibacter sp. Alg240-R139]